MSETAVEVEARSDGYQVVYQGKRLYTDANPRAAADRRAAAATIPPRHLIMVPSPLLWYGIDRLMARDDAPEAVLCVELDRNLAAFSAHNFPPALRDDPRLTFLTGDDQATLDAALTSIGVDTFSGCDIITLSGGFALNSRRYRALETHLRSVLRANWQNRLSLIRLGRRWLLNVFNNLAELPNSRSLDESTADRPTVLVGAGQSLEHCLDALQRFRSEVRIVAVDTALGSLYAAGIQPDYVIVLESQLINREHLLGFMRHGTTFVFDISSAPQIVRQVEPQFRCFFASRFTECAFLRRLERSGLPATWIPPRGSVAVAGLETLSNRIGRPLYLLGTDFSFQTGKPHARGTGSHRWYLRHCSRLHPDSLYAQAMQRPLVTLSDKNGAKARSDTILAGYRLQLLDVLSRIAGPAYDLSPGGLSIELPRAACDALGEHAFAGQSPVSGARAQPLAPPPTRTPPAPASSMVREFLEAQLTMEHALLSDAIGDLEQLYREGSLDPVVIRRVLSSCDYLEIDFPARVKPAEASASNVHQLLVSARHFARVLQNVLTRLAG